MKNLLLLAACFFVFASSAAAQKTLKDNLEGKIADRDSRFTLSLILSPLSFNSLAFKHKANMIPGKQFPNPETDSSFAKFRDSEKFSEALVQMKSEK